MKYPIAIHTAKSFDAFMTDSDTLTLTLKVEENRSNHVTLLYGDPFNWGPNEQDEWTWLKESGDHLECDLIGKQDFFDVYRIDIRPTTKRVKYIFVIDDQFAITQKGVIDLNDRPDQRLNLFNYFNYPFMNETDQFKAPSWVEDAIFYSIFIDRFSNSQTLSQDNVLPWNSKENVSNFEQYGGDLKGITNRLDYLSDLGINALYLTPIFKADSIHKYDIIDYFEIDPQFGTKEDLKQLVEEAHKRDIKVVLDAVYNHCGFRHPHFQDVLKNGKDSVWYDGFYVLDHSKPILDEGYTLGDRLPRELAKAYHDGTKSLNYRTFANTPYMPKINTDFPLWKEHLIKAALYWIDEFNIDGWRLDVSNEVSHSFWRTFREKIKNISSELYIVGENWDDASPWLQGDQYDAVMNYGFLFPIWDYFGTNTDRKPLDKSMFQRQISNVLLSYPKNVLSSLYNLIDSHDTTRILKRCSDDADVVKRAYLFLFSLPGAPSIYYGSEVGLTGEHDPDNRRCMPWNQEEWNQSLLDFIKTLIKLRKKEVGFKTSNMTWIDSSEDVLIYQKEDLTFVLFNNTNEKTSLPDQYLNCNYEDLLSGRNVIFDHSTRFKPYKTFVLKEVK
jgi:cyclomaltodextrinase